MAPIFRKESKANLGPEGRQTNYLSTPARFAWLLPLAALILLISFIIWGFTGSLPIAVSGKGYSKNDDATAHLFIRPELVHSRDIGPGNVVHLIFPDMKQIDGKVTYISGAPISRKDMEETYGYNEWVASVIAQSSEYNYVVEIKAEENLEGDTLFDAQIIEKTVSPIEYFLF